MNEDPLPWDDPKAAERDLHRALTDAYRLGAGVPRAHDPECTFEGEHVYHGCWDPRLGLRIWR